MDPVSLVLLIVLFEAATGGYLSATVGGAASAAWSATWREVAGSAKSSYANRATRLGQSKTGRWRLAAEKRAWNAGQRAQAGVAGLARGGGRAVAAGVKAAPDGARQWRESRRWTFGDVAGGLRRGVDVGWGRPPVADDVADEPTEEPPPVEEPPPTESAEDAKPFIPPAWLDRFEKVRGQRCTCCGMFHGIDWNPGIDEHCSWCREHQQPEEIPATDAGEKEEQVSTDLSGCAEDRGVKPYVEGWDGEAGGIERYVSELTVIQERMSAAVDANRRHDPDGAQDVVGKATAAVEALVAFGEAVDSHASVLHGKWDTTIEHLNSTGAESAQELVGAH